MPVPRLGIWQIIFAALLVAAPVSFSSAAQKSITAGVIADTITTPDYSISTLASGEALVGWQQAATERKTFGITGQPDLPIISEEYCLPANADAESVTIKATRISWEAVDGALDVAPIPTPAFQTADGRAARGIPPGARMSGGKDLNVYSADAAWPATPVRVAVTGQRKWSIARAEFCPWRYNPVTRGLSFARSVEFEITYTIHRPSRAERALMRDSQADDDVRRRIRNRDAAEEWYRADGAGLPEPAGGAAPGGGSAGTDDSSGGTMQAAGSGVQANFVIITTSAIRNASTALSNFVAMKQSLGFTVYVADETAWGGGTGNTASDRIRAWLKANYVSMGIVYVLLIGNPNPSSGDVPMKECWPRKGQSSDADSPTDYYYADLTGNWDKNGDGYYGDYANDFVAGGVDLTPEVYVGRIPYYGSISDLDSILNKLVAYETAPGDLSWRKTGLLPAAISNYANEDRSGWARVDGYPWVTAIKADVFNAAGTASFTMLEKSGLSPVTTACDLPITSANVIARWNSTPGYGFVSWWGHGDDTGAYRKYWSTDDGDHVPEAAEMTWLTFLTSSDTSSLSAAAAPIVCQVSCDNGYPEDTSNLQYCLLRRGASATVSATRVSWYAIGTWTPSYGTSYGDNASYGYYMPKKILLEHMTVGKANHWCRQNFGMGFGAESLMNVFDMNLYGDPSMSLDVPLAIATTSVAGGTSGQAYSAAISARGGTLPYTWTIVSGALPPGVTFASGALSGTPNTFGSYSFAVGITDSAVPPASASASYAMTIAPASVTFALAPGTNLVSIPFARSGFSTAEDIARAITSCTTVTTRLAYGWTTHPAGYTDRNNFAVAPGFGYAVNVTAASAFTVTGDWLSTSLSLPAGGSLISIPKSKSSLATAEALGMNIPFCSLVSERSGNGWSAHLTGSGSNNNFGLVFPGPYLVTLTGNANWP